MPLSAKQLAQVSALLDEALDIAERDRDAWLAAHPSPDAEVMAALTRALKQAPERETLNRDTHASMADSRSAAAYWLHSGRFSDLGFAGFERFEGATDGATSRADARRAGETMGRYRLLRNLGSGGMGTVWLAERIEGDIVRPVALKLPLRLSGNRQIAERFARERGVLSKLTHPNIATLYDAGVSDAGVPFLALEHVEGHPINEYADAQKLSIDARLSLFAQVLSAVQHAHECLVIHRDLKPSNILVKTDGTVKLLDFGIAKLMADDQSHDQDDDQDDDHAEGSATSSGNIAATNASDAAKSDIETDTDTDTDTDADADADADTDADASASDTAPQASDLTEQVGVAITPNYASPEQLANANLTTATDVYSLGVVLYQLLVGRRPYRLRHESQAALARDVLDVEIIRPSAALMAASLASLRQSSPANLRKKLHGDLDAILLKSLAKSTDNRYRTAQEFAADIQRYRNHQPVHAMPESVVYRLRKYVIRHRVSAIALAAVLIAVTAGVASSLWQLRETERELARRTAVQTFLVGIFKTADPEIARGKVYTAKELLSVGVARIDQQFSDQPEVAAALYGEIGMIFSALGDSKTAGELFAKKLKLLDAMGKTSSADYVDALTRYGRYLHDQGRREEALPALEKSVALASSLGATGDSARWDAMQKLAMVQMDRSQFTQAQSLLQTARAEIVARPAAKQPITLLRYVEYGLGVMAFNQGEHQKAIDYFQSVEHLQRSDAGLERVDAVRNSHNLAVNELALRRYGSARLRLEAVVAEHSKNLGATAASTLESKTQLAKAMLGMGRASESLAMQMEVVAAAKLGGNADDIAFAETLLIRKFVALKRFDEAGVLVRKSLNYFSGQSSGSIRLIEDIRTLSAEIDLASGRPAEALVAATLALENQRSVFPASSLNIAHTVDVVGAVQRALGGQALLREAERMHSQSVAVYTSQLGAEHVLTLRSELYLSLVRVALKTPGEPQKLSAISRKIAAQLPEVHPALRQLAAAEALANTFVTTSDAVDRERTENIFSLIDL